MKLHLQKIQLDSSDNKKPDSQSKESQSDTVSNEDAASHSKPSSTHSKIIVHLILKMKIRIIHPYLYLT